MKREEAVGLLKELGAEHLVYPSVVLIQERSRDKYELDMKGDFRYREVETFLKTRGFSFEENNDFLTIF